MKVIIFATGVKNFGYGNIIRSIEIAKELKKEINTNCEFLCLDEEAKKLINTEGFKADLIDISNLHYISDIKADAYIFDINSKFEMPTEMIAKLKNNGKKIIFIDNIKSGAKLADLIIIPTAHYTGKRYKNLLYGKEYIVVRDEILKTNISPKKSRILARVDSKYKDLIKKIWIKVEFIEDLEENFHIKLAESSLFITHLGVSCYEALYLKTNVIIIPRHKEELKEIEKFYANSLNISRKTLRTGKFNIVKKIKEVIIG